MTDHELATWLARCAGLEQREDGFWVQREKWKGDCDIPQSYQERLWAESTRRHYNKIADSPLPDDPSSWAIL